MARLEVMTEYFGYINSGVKTPYEVTLADLLSLPSNRTQDHQLMDGDHQLQSAGPFSTNH